MNDLLSKVSNEVERSRRFFSDPWSIILATQLIVACWLRLLLTFLNREANDDHFQVVERILQGQLPRAYDCYQCYHSLLWHTTCATFITAFGIKEDYIFWEQLINFFAALFLLAVGYQFIATICPRKDLRVLAFGLFSLNPQLIGINAQVTNDTFVILFSSLAIYYFWAGVDSLRKDYLLTALVHSILASLSKGSGLFVFFSLAFVLAVKLIVVFFQRDLTKQKFYGKALAFFLVIFLLTNSISLLNPYTHNYRTYGSIFNFRMDQKAPPKFWGQEARVPEPGVTSVVDSFFTFRLGSLLKTPYTPYLIFPTQEFPYIPYGSKDYPLHLTSLWTQLYAQSHFIHYMQWPRTWRQIDPFILNLGRVIFCLGLVPTAFILTGILKELKRIIQGIRSFSPIIVLDSAGLLFVGNLVLLMAMQIKLTYDLQYFHTMKIIYIYPGLLSLIYFFISGGTYFFDRVIENQPWLKTATYSLFSTLYFLYVIDILILIAHLSFQSPS